MDIKFEEGYDYWDFTALAEQSATSLGMVFNICKDGNYHEGTNTNVELWMPHDVNVKVYQVDSFSEFMDKFPYAVESWKSGVHLSSAPVEKNLERISTFANDMNVLHELFKSDFVIYTDRDEHKVLRDVVNGVDCFDVSYGRIADLKKSFQNSVDAMDLSVLASRMKVHDSYLNHLHVVDNHFFASEDYDKHAFDTFERLQHVSSALQKLEPFVLDNPVHTDTVELDMSEVGVRPSNHHDYVRI